MFRATSIAAAGCAISALVTLSGCGGGGVERPETVPVSGVVTLEGTPLAGAAVVMAPENGSSRPAVATTKDDGSFTMQTFVPGDGVIPGTYVITVNKMSESNMTYDAPGDESEDYEGVQEAGIVDTEGPQQVVPERYTKSDTTDLRAVVESGRPIEGMKLELSP